MSFCRCGGYIRVNEFDSYTGSLCNCGNPLIDQVGNIASTGLRIVSHYPGHAIVPSKYSTNTENVTLEEILPILQELAQYGDFENTEGVACMFCDMGDSGHSSCGNGFHDDDCISLMAKNILTKLGE